MKILFAGSYYYPLGGASDIVATDVKENGLEELLAAHNHLDWWHLYDTTKREIIKEGTFEKPKMERVDWGDLSVAGASGWMG